MEKNDLSEFKPNTTSVEMDELKMSMVGTLILIVGVIEILVGLIRPSYSWGWLLLGGGIATFTTGVHLIISRNISLTKRCLGILVSLGGILLNALGIDIVGLVVFAVGFYIIIFQMWLAIKPRKEAQMKVLAAVLVLMVSMVVSIFNISLASATIYADSGYTSGISPEGSLYVVLDSVERMWTFNWSSAFWVNDGLEPCRYVASWWRIWDDSGVTPLFFLSKQECVLTPFLVDIE